MGASFIALIPKKEGACCPKDFRPISLLSSHYKLVTRVLASRLRTVLHEVISNNQSAFLKGRQIIDSPLMIHELLHHYKKRGLKGMILKLDFEKAFDKVSWAFLNWMMLRMNFPLRWCEWIASCISSARYSIIINRSVHGYFKGSRGLRQGDPISPLLFDIVGEALCALFQKGQEKGWITGMGIRDIRIPILQFANDTLLLCDGIDEGLLHSKALLSLYEMMSGQNINWEKSGLFGVNAHAVAQDLVASILHCNRIQLPSSYLGLPLFQAKNNKALWNPIVEKYQRRLEGWKGQLLSQAGRATLIRATLAGIPNYWFSLILCPANVAKRYHVREGCSVKFWQDVWIGKDPLASSFPHIYRRVDKKDITVAECKNEANRSWNLHIRRSLNEHEIPEMSRLLSMLDSVFVSGVGTDEIFWSPCDSGEFTVASCYNLLSQREETTNCSLRSYVWKFPVPPKIKQFIWTTSLSKILTCDELERRGQLLWLERNSRVFNNQCSSLGGVIEKVIHNTLLWAGASQKLPPFPSSVIRQAGIGGAVRDSGGHCIFVYSGSAGCCSSNEAEAQAMLIGVKLLREHVTEPVYVEGDSKLVIRWAKAGKPPWRLKPIFYELKLVTA
ncbi:hypothetical protein H6P81_007265 [Aristolochia fimbriata]|uniref:Reverse transcriptase domain-containing protein n=1 Tax=Aristolochia fimbriata TaxID=158543 RepID=A0AAV7F2H4_ARIFI|nr:hypothetical protein H6P81_007265 [Aristolochia fimbriata]